MFGCGNDIIQKKEQRITYQCLVDCAVVCTVLGPKLSSTLYPIPLYLGVSQIFILIPDHI